MRHAKAAVVEVGTFAVNQNIDAVFFGLEAGFVHLDFDGMKRHAFVLEEVWSEFLEIFPIDFDDAMVETASFGVLGGA